MSFIFSTLSSFLRTWICCLEKTCLHRLFHWEILSYFWVFPCHILPHPYNWSVLYDDTTDTCMLRSRCRLIHSNYILNLSSGCSFSIGGWASLACLIHRWYIYSLVFSNWSICNNYGPWCHISCIRWFWTIGQSWVCCIVSRSRFPWFVSLPMCVLAIWIISCGA